jgi:hypothetical protein
MLSPPPNLSAEKAFLAKAQSTAKGAKGAWVRAMRSGIGRTLVVLSIRRFRRFAQIGFK